MHDDACPACMMLLPLSRSLAFYHQFADTSQFDSAMTSSQLAGLALSPHAESRLRCKGIATAFCPAFAAR